jgi:hypothetical protein
MVTQRTIKEVGDMQYHHIDAPLFPVLPRPLQERMAPSGLLQAVWRWTLRGAMHRDETATLSRRTGGRI